MRTFLFTVFVIAGASVLVFSHYYLFRKLVRATRLPRVARYVATGFLILLASLIPLAFVLPRVVSRDVAAPLSAVTYYWLGLMFYLVVLLALTDVARLVTRLTRRLRRKKSEPERPADPERRVFLARVVAGASLAAGGALTLLGVRSALGEIDTPEVPVRLSRLPESMSGFRLAVLSDLHVGPVLGKRFVEEVVEKTNALRPDVVAILGDLVDMPVALLGDQIAPIGRLRAPHGVFFVNGNHEYFNGVEEWMGFIRSLGIRVLANERVAIGDPEGARGFDLAGVHDVSAAWFRPDMVPDLGRALAGRDPERELVLLAHQPKQIHEAAEAGVGLQLSGHTHGGQIFPFGLLTMMAQPYVRGLHRHTETTQIYVTRGTGFWGPPMRVLSPPEISCIVLTSRNSETNW